MFFFFGNNKKKDIFNDVRLVPLTGHFILKLSWNMQFATGATRSKNGHVCVIVEHPMTKNFHWGCENVLKSTLYQTNLQKHEARGNSKVTSWLNLALQILLRSFILHCSLVSSSHQKSCLQYSAKVTDLFPLGSELKSNYSNIFWQPDLHAHRNHGKTRDVSVAPYQTLFIIHVLCS